MASRISLLLVLAAGCALAASPPWKHEYAKVNGVRLHYVTQGKGPLIIFLHGFPEFWYEWKDQLPEFGKDHRAVAPDMRGYNLSEKPAGGGGSLPDERSGRRYSRLGRASGLQEVHSRRSRLGRRRGMELRHRASGISRKAGHYQLSASRCARARACRKSRAAEGEPIHAAVPQPDGRADVVG